MADVCNLYINYSDVTCVAVGTPSQTVVITEVTKIQKDTGDQQETWKGGCNRFDVLNVLVKSNRTFGITSGDQDALDSLDPKRTYTVTYDQFIGNPADTSHTKKRHVWSNVSFTRNKTDAEARKFSTSDIMGHAAGINDDTHIDVDPLTMTIQ